MDNNLETLAVSIQSNRGRTSAGTVQLRTWDKKERTARGIKVWAMSWGGAVVTLFIPLVHFFAVPLLLFAGPMLFFIFTAEQKAILGGEGTCPDCGQKIAIVRSPYKWPISDMCNHCQVSLKITPATS